jgi:ABC-2 type transport system permease protein
MTAYRTILYHKEFPDIISLLILLLISIVLLIVGYVIFNKCEKSFAEEL